MLPYKGISMSILLLNALGSAAREENRPWKRSNERVTSNGVTSLGVYADAADIEDNLGMKMDQTDIDNFLNFEVVHDEAEPARLAKRGKFDATCVNVNGQEYCTYQWIAFSAVGFLVTATCLTTGGGLLLGAFVSYKGLLKWSNGTPNPNRKRDNSVQTDVDIPQNATVSIMRHYNGEGVAVDDVDDSVLQAMHTFEVHPESSTMSYVSVRGRVVSNRTSADGISRRTVYDSTGEFGTHNSGPAIGTPDREGLRQRFKQELVDVWSAGAEACGYTSACDQRGCQYMDVQVSTYNGKDVKDLWGTCRNIDRNVGWGYFQ